MFRTLQIGSLRYWGSTVQVVKTQVFSQLEIETDTDDMILTRDESETEIIVQDSVITLEFGNEIDFILEENDTKQEGVCL